MENFLNELSIVYNERSILSNDNQAMINFVHGEGIAKGVRHMEMRQWYIRENYKKDNYEFVYENGKTLPPDKLTKLSDCEGHARFAYDIMGMALIMEWEENSIVYDLVRNEKCI